MTLFTRTALETAAEIVYAAMPPTPQYRWPLLEARYGGELWVKHENHTPTGAFKVRGGLTYVDRLPADCPGLITATRGNHGQSIPFAARRRGLSVTVYVPEGNAAEKNAAMRAWGANLVVHGHDFEAARLACIARAEAEGLRLVPSFHPDLCLGVATYARELFAAAPLDTVYVPIGMGSGICSVITVRDLFGLDTEIVGVVAEGADAYAQSFEQGAVVATEAARTFADGMACRTPDPTALEIIRRGAARVLRVGDAAIAEAIRAYYTDTHNVAEGAGAAPLAAALQERAEGRDPGRAAVILCGGNIDGRWMAGILAGGTPSA